MQKPVVEAERFFFTPSYFDKDIDVCISAVGTNDYPDLAKCKKATVGDEEFPGLAVFIIE